MDVISDPAEDILLGQTLKRPLVTEHLVEALKHGRPETQCQDLKIGGENDSLQEFVSKATSDQSNFCFSHFYKVKNVLLSFYRFIL